MLLSTHSSLLIGGSPFLLLYGGSPPASVVVVVYPHLPDLWEVSAHSTEVTGSTVFSSHQDLGVMVSSFRTRRQCLSFSGRGKPSQGQRSTSGVESPDGGKGWKAFVELIRS